MDMVSRVMASMEVSRVMVSSKEGEGTTMQGEVTSYQLVQGQRINLLI